MEAEGQHDQPDFGRESFWVHRGQTFTNITSADPETRTLRGVEIFERATSGRIVRVIRADEVHVAEDGTWQLDRADVWHFDPDDTTRDPRFEPGTALTLHPGARQRGMLLGADPGMLPIRDLRRYLDGNPKETASGLRRLRARFHERLSSPWLVFVFAWLALPFALRVDRRGRFAGPAAAAVATLGAYFLLESAGTTISIRELMPVGLTPWLMMATALMGGAIALRVRAR